MNQCQWSDEKIIKKQTCSVLNTAKGKRPILLYRSAIWMEKKEANRWREREASGGADPYRNGCQNALQKAL